MPGILLEGRTVVASLKADIERAVARCSAAHGRPPCLVALQIGEDESASVYARAQKRAAESVGIRYAIRALPASATEEAAKSEIAGLNADTDVTGIILQCPVPAGLDGGRLAAAIAPAKDAEGIHPCNLGKLLLGTAIVSPCTAEAVMELLAMTGVDLRGKETVVVGHSPIVGKPLALMLLDRLATTTVCHVATGERGFLAEHVSRAEILVVAVGKPGVVKGAWVRPGAIVIDVGINRMNDRVVGDVEFDAARERASYITPVPGGVGPLTVMMLMRNVAGLAGAASQ